MHYNIESHIVSCKVAVMRIKVTIIRHYFQDLQLQKKSHRHKVTFVRNKVKIVKQSPTVKCKVAISRKKIEVTMSYLLDIKSQE